MDAPPSGRAGLAAGIRHDVGDRDSAKYTHTFVTVGTFSYTCTIHAGMNGTVIVTN